MSKPHLRGKRLDIKPRPARHRYFCGGSVYTLGNEDQILPCPNRIMTVQTQEPDGWRQDAIDGWLCPECSQMRGMARMIGKKRRP